LITLSVARIKRQNTEESRRYQADPLAMFQIPNLLNRPPPPRLCTSVEFGHYTLRLGAFLFVVIRGGDINDRKSWIVEHNLRKSLLDLFESSQRMTSPF
jgi:hypothetical protein